MPALFSSRRMLYMWIALAAAVLISASILRRWAVSHSQERLVPVAAYIVAADASSRVKFNWWRSTPVSTVLTVPSGATVRVPDGARVRIVYPDGRSETLVGPTKLNVQQAVPAEANALISPLPEVIDAMKKDPSRPRDGVRVTSPVGVTRYLNPLIAWQARDNVLYDVAVGDPANPAAPLRVARGVRPPVQLAELTTTQKRQLARDRIYELIVREVGATEFVAGARFLTTPEASADAAIPEAPADLIADAANAMAKKPTRTGDAWLALSRLPPGWADSELGVRLRLAVASELDLADELARAQDAAKALLKR